MDIPKLFVNASYVEIREALFSMTLNKIPRSDDFSVRFFEKFWIDVGHD